jgi:hypothetical protein
MFRISNKLISENSPKVKNFKRIISLVIAVFVFSAILSTFTSHKFTITAETFENFEYTVTDDKATITKYTSAKDTDIVIPPILGGYYVTSISSTAFQNCYDIVNLEIPNTITKLSAGTFFNCVLLKTVKIPESVTEIANTAFDTSIKFTVIGSEGSYAEQYAKDKILPFSNGIKSSNLTLEVGAINIIPETADITAGFVTAEVPLYLSGEGSVSAIQTSIILGDGNQYTTVPAENKTLSLEKVLPNKTLLGEKSYAICQSTPGTGNPADIEKGLYNTQTDLPSYMFIMAFNELTVTATPVHIATLQVKIVLTAESLEDFGFDVSIVQDVTYVTVDSAMCYLSEENGVKNGSVTLKGVWAVFNGKYGDVDCDGYVTINDVVYLLGYVGTNRVFTLEQRLAGDVFIERDVITVDVVDLVTVISYILQIDGYTELPIKAPATPTVTTD